MAMFNLNRNDIISKDPSNKIVDISPTDAPPNVHGDRLFLIKLQIEYSGLAPSSNMMIYDRQRSFSVFFGVDGHEAVFRQVREEMQGPRGGFRGLKMYRWAKRIGDWQLSVCLDRPPQQEIKW